MNKWQLILRHRWRDQADSERALPDAAAQRLQNHIAASERRHSGELRVVVESALPLSYLWRVGPTLTLDEAVRQRALSWFGRLRIWDTEHNNGVLIYLLLAEHQVEIVADRDLARRVDAATWEGIVSRLSAPLQAQAFEAGLTAALDEVSALLESHFPLDPGAGDARINQLSDLVVRC